MNHLFALPLHGVCCVPFAERKSEGKRQGKSEQSEEISADHCYEITLTNEPINLPPSLKPLWALTDEGERYYSEITLYKEELTEQAQQPEQTNAHITTNKNLPLNSKHSKQTSNQAVYYLKINCQGNGLFKLNNNHITIDWQQQGTEAAHYFQTMAMALFLECKNVLCLHANALVVNNQTIALVAPSRTGKTTLTAALSKMGFALMTDDMIALHPNHSLENGKKQQGNKSYTVYPSWPVARMWPDALTSIQGSSPEQHKKVHEEFDKRIVDITPESGFNFCNKPKPLKVIYLLNRLPEGQTLNTAENKVNLESNKCCELVNIPTSKAIILLLQNSMLGSCYRELGLEQSRMKALCELVSHISFKQINYLSGKEHLAEIGELIKQDVALT